MTAAKNSRWLAPCLVIAVTTTAFLPALWNGFVIWDDDANFLNNPHYRGLGWQQLSWMFTTFHLGPYQPLSWVTLGLDYLIWGMNPFGYHLTNLLLHATNAVVFYFVAARLLSLAFSSSREESSIILGASLAALLFAIHPLRVESVAWVTERRDVLSGLFFLFAVQFYLTAATAETPARYKKWLALTLVVYVLSLLAKAAAVTLPVVLLVLDVYPLGRVGRVNRQWFAKASRTILVEKIPFVFFAAVAGWVALLGQYSAAAARALEQTGLIERVAQAFYSLVFYLRKTLVPIGISPLHEMPQQLDPLDWAYLASAVVVIGITVALILLRRRWPAGLAVWVSYVALVAPVSGIVQVGPQLVAERYSYLSCLGWALLAGGGVVYFRCYSETKGWILAGGVFSAMVLALIGLSYLTWKQTQVWHDTESLWRHAVSLDPESTIARNQLGNALADRGALEEAIEHYRRALRIRPAYAGAHYNLAMALADRGEVDGAMRHYEEAVRFDPANANAHNNLGAILAQRGELDAAIEHYHRALQIRPEFPEARDNLSRALAIRSRREQANR
jgi:tetratricopeptide (TPR) repeat protein